MKMGSKKEKGGKEPKARGGAHDDAGKGPGPGGPGTGGGGGASQQLGKKGESAAKEERKGEDDLVRVRQKPEELTRADVCCSILGTCSGFYDGPTSLSLTESPP